jgi:type IV pilus assembly protein PilB
MPPVNHPAMTNAPQQAHAAQGPHLNPGAQAAQVTQMTQMTAEGQRVVPQARRRKKVGEILLAQGYINKEQLESALDQHQATGISLGTVLLKLGFIDEDTLNSVLGKQLEFSYRKRIGEILVEYGYITQKQLEEGLSKQKQLNLPLGKTLVKLGFIDEIKILDVLAAQLDLQHVVLENFKFDPNVTHLISEEMARSYRVVPLYEKEGVLTVAMVDPTNLRSLDHMKFKTGKDVEPVIATEPEIMAAIERAYSNAQHKLADLMGKDEDKELVLTKEKDDDDAGMPLADEEGRQIVKIVNLLISEAIRLGASDIHLEPQEKNMRIRYRIDGELMEQNPIPSRLMVQVISRMKVLGSMDIAEKRRPLDGRAHIAYKGKEVDLRLSTFPVLLRSRGVMEKMVIRIIDPNQEVASLDKVGFGPNVYPAVQKLMDLPDGIILVTGPTGSGKSSTLYAFIKHLNQPGVNIVTMEDPVEKNISGISQGQINNLAGFTFAAGIRSILRQDPDVIMLGEMRDKETCEMAVQASLTGHLVFSTLHTNDAPSAFTRLLDMGLEPFLITSCVKGVFAQRLVRRICEKCRAPVQMPDVFLQNIGVMPGTTFYQGKGCNACNNTGYRGRLAIFELLLPDEHIHRMVIERKSSDEMKQYAIQKLGMSTLRRDGLEKALAGLTTVEQVVSVSQAEM